MQNKVLKTTRFIKACHFKKNALYQTTVKNAFNKLLAKNLKSFKNDNKRSTKINLNNNLKI